MRSSTGLACLLLACAGGSSLSAGGLDGGEVAGVRNLSAAGLGGGEVAGGVRPDSPVPDGGDPDSLELHRRARDAQARFERLRIRLLPRSGAAGGGPCDERVGRFCTRYDEGDWTPEPESEELRQRREELLATLDSVGRRLPGDGWVAGQRVWYRVEARAWEEALRAARSCGAERWWCRALEGWALHGAGRHGEAREAFDEALAAMEGREARDWRYPLRAVDGEARELLEAAEEVLGPAGGSADPTGDPHAAAARELLRRFWLLADPLWLVPGNDRRTAHYARWTASMARVGARNPYGISWGRDLEELTVRHGWELGWEQGWPRPGYETDVTGHKHPEGRDYFPPGRALADPGGAGAEALRADRTRPRSLYAPGYAPLVLPMEGQVAVFPRGERVAVVATHFLPPDTSWHRSHQHGRPWLAAGDQAGLPERAGLFLAPAGPPLDLSDGRLRPRPGVEDPGSGGNRRAGAGGGTRPPDLADGPTVATKTTGSAPGQAGLVVEAPAGRWVLSVERWSPPDRRAGRWRQGLVHESIPPDVATLSDLLLVGAGSTAPSTLEEAARRALPRARVAPGDRFGVVWEVGGLGWRGAEAVRYSLVLRGEGGNLIQRAGRWLGILGEDEPLRLSWEEAGPERPGRVLRHLELEPGLLEPGGYRLVLEVELPGRAPLRAERLLEVADPGTGPAR